MQPNADSPAVEYFNTADFLRRFAASMPDAIAVAQPLYEGRTKRPLRDPAGKRVYSTLTFAELDQDSDRIAAALGEIKISTEPNLKTSCPGADMLQNEWNGRGNGELY